MSGVQSIRPVTGIVLLATLFLGLIPASSVLARIDARHAAQENTPVPPEATQTAPPPTAVPTKPPPPPVVRFDSASLNQTVPGGIRAHISYPELGARMDACQSVPGKPSLGLGEIPLPYDAPGWNKPLDLLSCGWQPSERVTLTARLPDGRRLELGAQPADGKGVLPYVYDGDRDDSAGTHTFSFRGAQSGVAELRVRMMQPDGARLYLEPDGYLYLHQFQPGESVRLFEYCSAQSRGPAAVAPLTAWAEFTVDGLGRLLVQLDKRVVTDTGRLIVRAVSGDGVCDYIAVAPGSGEVHVAGRITSATFAPISSLDVIAVRASTQGDRLRVREEASSSAPEMTRVPADTELPVVSALARDDGIWWHIRLLDGRTGWAMDRFVTRINRTASP